MESQQSDLEAMQDRLLKLEKQTCQLKRRRTATLILLAALLSVLFSSDATPGQAPTPQASASKPASADRSSALENKVAGISQRLTFLQKEITTLQILAAGRSESRGNTDTNDLQELKEKAGDLDDEVSHLKRDVSDLTDEVEMVKGDIPSVSESDMSNLKNDAESLKSFRKAICSLSWSSSAYLTLHSGFPEPCPAF